MKRLVAIAVATLLLGGRTCVAAEGLMDGRRLLSYCEETERQGPKVNPFRLGYCMAFIEGTLKGWEAAALVRDLTLNYCIAPGAKFDEILRAVVKHLRSNPSDLGGKAELLVISAVQKAFPCPPKRS